MKAAVDGDEVSMPSADGSQSISHVGNARLGSNLLDSSQQIAAIIAGKLKMP